MELSLMAQDLFPGSIHAFACRTLRKPRNRGVTPTAGNNVITVTHFYVNNNMQSYMSLMLTQI
jgi:hypothetical protein